MIFVEGLIRFDERGALPVRSTSQSQASSRSPAGELVRERTIDPSLDSPCCPCSQDAPLLTPSAVITLAQQRAGLGKPTIPLRAALERTIADFRCRLAA